MAYVEGESGNKKPAVSLSGEIDEYRRGRAAGNGNAGITGTSQQILGDTPKRVWAIFTNDGAETIWLALGEPATLNKGIRLNPNGGSFQLDQNCPWTGSVHAIASGAVNMLVQEVLIQ